MTSMVDPRGGSSPSSVLHPGVGSGKVLKLDLPLSFWGGVNHEGTIIDPHHPQFGESLTGRVLAMTSGRGSSSSSSVLAELLRAGAGPSAILLTDPDAMVVLGAIVATELYGFSIPVVRITHDDLDALRDGDPLTVEACSATVRLVIHNSGRGGLR